MSWREDDRFADDRMHVSPRNRDGSRRRVGPRLGPVRLTPTRVTLAVALLGSVAFLFYASTVRDTSQIALLAAGAFVLGIVFAALAVAGAIGTYRAASWGANGRAFGLALLGGIAAVIAFGCLAGALILAFLSPRY
jgi:MFS family permease